MPTRAMDVVNIKLSKVGGLTVARQMRDFCVAMGIAMTIENSGSGDIVMAAIAHLAHSTPDSGPQQHGGYIKAPTGPGLGEAPYLDVLGKAVLTI